MIAHAARLLALTSLLAACGGSSPDPVEPDDAPPPASTASPQADAEAACEVRCADDGACLEGCLGAIDYPCGDDPEAAGFRVRDGERCFRARAHAFCQGRCGGSSGCIFTDEEVTPRVFVECRPAEDAAEDAVEDAAEDAPEGE